MDTETLGQRLKRLRERAGLTQAQLAAAADVPIGTLRGAEYDRREPLVSTAYKLALALGISLDELVGTVPAGDATQDAKPPTEPKPRGRPRKPAPDDTPAKKRRSKKGGVGEPR